MKQPPPAITSGDDAVDRVFLLQSWQRRHAAARQLQSQQAIVWADLNRQLALNPVSDPGEAFPLFVAIKGRVHGFL